MPYFQSPVFDLFKLGKSIKVPASRRAFARHVVELAAKLAQQAKGIEDLNQSRELLHDQIARLTWKSYLWIFPFETHRMDRTIYPVTGYEDVLPDSLLGTALAYRAQLSARDPEDQQYTRLMVRTGLEWACLKADREGRPNALNDMPELELEKVNAILQPQSQSAAQPLAQAERQRKATRPGLAVRGTFSPARAWRPAVVARLARTLGRTRNAAVPLAQNKRSIPVVKLLFILNTLLTLPFGIAALAAPVQVFAQFGLKLDPGGTLIARGYAATLIGYGIVLWLLRHVSEKKVVNPLLISLAVFNAIEAVIQGVAGAEGLTLPVIFANVGLHGLVCGACAYAYFKQV